MYNAFRKSTTASLLKLLVPASLFFLWPFLSHAHTRWFAQGEIVPYVPTEPTYLYLAIIGVIVLLIIAIGATLERRNLLKLSFLRPKSEDALERAASTLSMITGTFFMIAGSHEYLFSPNLTTEAGIPMFLCMTQFAVGLMLVLGVFARVAGFFLVALWFVAIHYAGLEALMENIWVLAVASFIMVMGNDYFSIFSVKSLIPAARKLKSYALPALRIGTGVTLLTLGFTEKILRPELGLNFLAQHDWNFMSSFGFSDYLFVLSAGAVESLLGLLFIFGIMTRLTALVTAIIFITPLFILGPIELTGHLPHFAAIFVILIFGPGKHFRLLYKNI